MIAAWRIERRMWSFSVLFASGVLLYADVLRRLVLHWSKDDNYSHGFLIVPLAMYFAYERRGALRNAEPRPNALYGLLMIGASLLLLAGGTLGSEFFLTRVSLIVAIAGAVLFLLGPGHLRILRFPLAFLLLMVPIPALVFNQIAFPLQMLASRFGEAVISSAGIPVIREGNVIVLASTTLEVAEACSGIRSLVSLLTLAIVLGYFSDPRGSVRVLVALAALPMAIMANGLRVAGTGIAAHYLGPAAADGFLHTFSGSFVFATAVLMLLAVMRMAKIVLPSGVTAPAASGQLA